jgi:microsomal epoxide hydrolase
MRALGFEHYGVFGTDAGAFVAATIALNEPAAVVGLHLQLGGIVLARTAREQGADGAVDEVERRALAALASYEAHDAAYAYLNATKPYTLAYALTDSPVGQAAWILDKFRSWADTTDDTSRPFGLVDIDAALAIVTTYWVTGTAGTAAQFYAAPASVVADPATRVVRVPTGCAVFPSDIVMASRRWAEARYPSLVHWTEMPRGGHFGALEVPELLVDDLRAFFRPLRKAGLEVSRGVA